MTIEVRMERNSAGMLFFNIDIKGIVRILV